MATIHVHVQKWSHEYRSITTWDFPNCKISSVAQRCPCSTGDPHWDTGVVKCMSCFLFISPTFSEASGAVASRLPLGYHNPFDLQPAGPLLRRCCSSHEVCSQAPPDSETEKMLLNRCATTYCTGVLLLKAKEVQPFSSHNFVHSRCVFENPTIEDHPAATSPQELNPFADAT
jgi:hypothetical protein